MTNNNRNMRPSHWQQTRTHHRIAAKLTGRPSLALKCQNYQIVVWPPPDVAARSSVSCQCPLAHGPTGRECNSQMPCQWGWTSSPAHRLGGEAWVFCGIVALWTGVVFSRHFTKPLMSNIPPPSHLLFSPPLLLSPVPVCIHFPCLLRMTFCVLLSCDRLSILHIFTHSWNI